MVLPGERGINARLLDPRLSPGRTVLLSTEPACYFPEPSGAPAETHESPFATILDYRAERMVVETRSARPSYLVMSESFDPGWHARVDGKEAAVLEANLYFRAVPLTAGSHRVELFYRPASYIWGWRVFGLSLIVVVFAGWLLRTDLSETWITALLVMASVAPPLIGLFGWRSAREIIDPERCGQLRVAERLPSPNVSSRRLGPLAIEAFDVAPPSEITWQIGSSPSRPNRLVRLFAAAQDRTVETRIAALEVGADPISLSDVRPSRQRERWVAVEAPVPSETEKLLLEVKAGSPSTASWGNPMILEPRARQTSKVCFVMPETTRGAGLLSDRADDRVRVLLTLETAAAQDGFDEVHFASDQADFSTRMLSLARTLYRRGTFLVLESADSAFTRRQNLLERELRRLDLGDHVVVETCRRRKNGS